MQSYLRCPIPSCPERPACACLPCRWFCGLDRGSSSPLQARESSSAGAGHASSGGSDGTGTYNPQSRLWLSHVTLVVPCAEVRLMHALMVRSSSVPADGLASQGTSSDVASGATRLDAYLSSFSFGSLLHSSSLRADGSRSGDGGADIATPAGEARPTVVLAQASHWGWAGEWVTLTCAAPASLDAASAAALEAQLDLPLNSSLLQDFGVGIAVHGPNDPGTPPMDISADSGSDGLATPAVNPRSTTQPLLLSAGGAASAGMAAEAKPQRPWGIVVGAPVAFCAVVLLGMFILARWRSHAKGVAQHSSSGSVESSDLVLKPLDAAAPAQLKPSSASGSLLSQQACRCTSVSCSCGSGGESAVRIKLEEQCAMPWGIAGLPWVQHTERCQGLEQSMGCGVAISGFAPKGTSSSLVRCSDAVSESTPTIADGASENGHISAPAAATSPDPAQPGQQRNRQDLYAWTASCGTCAAIRGGLTARGLPWPVTIASPGNSLRHTSPQRSTTGHLASHADQTASYASLLPTTAAHAAELAHGAALARSSTPTMPAPLLPEAEALHGMGVMLQHSMGTAALHVSGVVLREGSHSVVYAGTWHGMAVAVKVLVLPTTCAYSACMAAVSHMATASSLSHPHLLATLEYRLLPLSLSATHSARHVGGDVLQMALSMEPTPADIQGLGVADRHALASVSTPAGDPAAAGSEGSQAPVVGGWQLMLVQELCALGSLADALRAGLLCGPAGSARDDQAAMQAALDLLLQVRGESPVGSVLPRPWARGALQQRARSTAQSVQKPCPLRADAILGRAQRIDC